MIIQLFIEPIYYFLAKFDTIAFSHFIQGMDGVRDSSPHTPRLSSVFFPAIQQINRCLFFHYFIILSQWGSNTDGAPWYHYTFPIAFSTVFDVIDGYSSPNTGNFYGYTKNVTNTGFDMRIYQSETGRYIAIGI